MKRFLDWNQALSDLKKTWEKMCDLKHSQDSAEGIQGSTGKSNYTNPLQIPQQVSHRGRYANAGLDPKCTGFSIFFLILSPLFFQV